MDENLPKGFKTFDVFPKVSSSYSIRSSRGGFVTILLGVVCTFFIWIQLAAYVGGVEEHMFSVDKSIQTNMQLNIDMTLAMSCDGLTANVQDTSYDRLLASELLQFQPTVLDVAKKLKLSQHKVYENLHQVLRAKKKTKFSKGHFVADGAACRIYGSLPVNKVKGNFHVTARGFGYMDRQMMQPHGRYRIRSLFISRSNN